MVNLFHFGWSGRDGRGLGSCESKHLVRSWVLERVGLGRGGSASLVSSAQRERLINNRGVWPAPQIPLELSTFSGWPGRGGSLSSPAQAPSHVPPRCRDCLNSPGGAVRSAPSRTGFVIASPPFPPSAAPPLPARPRLPHRAESQPGSPGTGRHHAGAPEETAAGRPDAREEQVRPWEWDPQLLLAVRPSYRARPTRTGCWGWGG